MALPRRQQETLEWIRAYMKMHGKPPTMREIGDHFGRASSSVFEVITALEHKGFLTRSERLSRGIALTPKAGAGKKDAVNVPILGRPRLTLRSLRECRRVFGRLVAQTDAAFSAFLHNEYGIPLPW